MRTLIANDSFLSKLLGEVRENASICAYCRYDLTGYGRLPYEEKLILALKHPIRENRMLAIQLLGDLRSKKAISVFEAMLHDETDFYVIREVVRSRKIGGKDSEQLLSSLSEHSSSLVRKLVI
jgi:hypothetical protein